MHSSNEGVRCLSFLPEVALFKAFGKPYQVTMSPTRSSNTLGLLPDGPTSC